MRKRTPRQIIGDDAFTQLIFEGFAIVPIDPTPEAIGSWNRVKNGFHYENEPKPTDTSDYAAYRALVDAASQT